MLLSWEPASRSFNLTDNCDRVGSAKEKPAVSLSHWKSMAELSRPYLLDWIQRWQTSSFNLPLSSWHHCSPQPEHVTAVEDSSAARRCRGRQRARGKEGELGRRNVICFNPVYGKHTKQAVGKPIGQGTEREPWAERRLMWHRANWVTVHDFPLCISLSLVRAHNFSLCIYLL